MVNLHKSGTYVANRCIATHNYYKLLPSVHGPNKNGPEKVLGPFY